jgi:hypothetical protein
LILIALITAGSRLVDVGWNDIDTKLNENPIFGSIISREEYFADMTGLHAIVPCNMWFDCWQDWGFRVVGRI